MNSLIIHSSIVILPLVFSSILHMIVVKKDWFNSLTTPISVKLFGENKTWRGFAFVGICNAFFLFSILKLLKLNLEHHILLGFILGIAYMISELPNSFIKRRLGIKSGETKGIQFSIIDKMDSAFGVSITYYLLGYTDLKTALILVLISSFTHMFFSKILVLLKIKKSF